MGTLPFPGRGGHPPRRPGFELLDFLSHANRRFIGRDGLMVITVFPFLQHGLQPRTECRTLCHLDPDNSDYTRTAGTDGDATGMVGRSGDCLDCHTETKPFIHHATAGIVYTPATDCTLCHNTTSGFAGDHQTLVVDNAPCSGCHTAAAPVDSNNVPVDATPGNLVHDACISCHVITPVTNMVDTIDPITSPLVSTMNNVDGATATNNGGGNCSACHTAYFDSHNHDHTSSVTKTPTCTTTACHDQGATGNARGANISEKRMKPLIKGLRPRLRMG